MDRRVAGKDIGVTYVWIGIVIIIGIHCVHFKEKPGDSESAVKISGRDKMPSPTLP